MKVEKKTVTLKDGKVCVIRNLEAGDAAAVLKHLRQVAVETPYLLMETEEVDGMTEEEERDYLTQSAESANEIMLGAFWEGELVAIASVNGSGKRSRISHRGTLGISLQKVVWGVGLGSCLMQILIEAAPQIRVTQIELGVIASNQRAISLYEKMGFRRYGLLPNASRLKTGEVLDEALMVLSLS